MKRKIYLTSIVLVLYFICVISVVMFKFMKKGVDLDDGTYHVLKLYRYKENDEFKVFIPYKPGTTEFKDIEAKLEESISLFEALYSNLRKVFGIPLDLDQNGQITILIHEMVSDGYVHGEDFDINQEDIIRINVNQLKVSSYYTSEDCAAILLHEVQHLVQKRIDPDEGSYIHDLISIFVEDYYLPTTTNHLRRLEYLERLSKDQVYLDKHQYAELLFLGRYLFEYYGGIETMLAIQKNQKNDYASLLDTLKVNEFSQNERDFIYNLLDYTLGSFLFRFITESELWLTTEQENLSLQSRQVTVRFLKPESKRTILTLESDYEEDVEYLVKEMSMEKATLYTSDVQEMSSYRFKDGSYDINLEEKSNILIIVPIYVGQEIIQWSYKMEG